jgi:hypothetical protein
VLPAQTYVPMVFTGQYYVTASGSTIYYSEDRATWLTATPGVILIKGIAVGVA